MAGSSSDIERSFSDVVFVVLATMVAYGWLSLSVSPCVLLCFSVTDLNRPLLQDFVTQRNVVDGP